MNKVARAGIAASATVVFLLTLASPAFAPCHVGSFVNAPYRVAEGAGTVTITYSNGAGAQPGGTVDYRTANGTAKAPKDYEATSGTLRWGTAGGTAVSVSGVNPAYRGFEVPIRQDSIDEPNETFSIQMSHFTGCFDASLSEKTATVTIVDDDAAPALETTSPTPTPKIATPTGKPTPTPTPTASRTPTPTLTASATPTTTAVAVSDQGTSDGLSGGVIALIVIGALAVGGAAAYLVRRRFLT